LQALAFVFAATGGDIVAAAGEEQEQAYYDHFIIHILFNDWKG